MASRIYLPDLPLSKKNDYSMTFKLNGVTVFFLKYVQTPRNAIKWVSQNARDRFGRQVYFDTIFVYERRTRVYLGYIKYSGLL